MGRRKEQTTGPVTTISGRRHPPLSVISPVPHAIDSATLLDLHHVLQAAFGWYDCHRLAAVAAQGTAIRYVYDFGDDWVHRVVVEKAARADPPATYPSFIGGKRACPPEDCGGVWGYGEFLAAISIPRTLSTRQCSSGSVGSSTPRHSTRPTSR